MLQLLDLHRAFGSGIGCVVICTVFYCNEYILGLYVYARVIELSTYKILFYIIVVFVSQPVCYLVYTSTKEVLFS